MISRNVQLNLAQGLHIRSCSKIVALVGQFPGKILILHGERAADANSIFDLLQLAAAPGAQLVVQGDGDGAESIVDAVVQLLSQPADPVE